MLKDRRQVNALPIIDKVKSIVINCASVSILGHTPEWTAECKQCSRLGLVVVSKRCFLL